ncbi:sulfatase-like hydrolase/transferase [Labrenzia sp. CE80]|uniref:sulfatase-like hydrolase/transferase n=1 Tax=Labrenzia sp. CE80 TaxID=1788986 RepID=UPI00129BEC87|nr:sulfatase-like hydrolase/transferase [Labrenzia sp. CE80]
MIFLNFLAAIMIDKRFVALVAFLGAIGIAVAERHVPTLPMAYCIAVAMIAFFVVLTARLITSIYVSLSLLALISFVSYAKMKWMSIAPNVVDVYYFAMNPGTLSFLFDSFLPYVVIAALLLLLTLVGALFVGRYEVGSRRGRHAACIVFPVAVAMVFVFQPKDFQGIRDLMRFRYVTSVFTSFKYLAYLGDEVPLLDRLSAPGKSRDTQNAAAKSCQEQESKPDIVVVQAESVVPAEILFQGRSPTLLQGRFNGEDDVLRPLNVETFAGGTWVTTAGFAASLPISDLGWLKSYSNFILEDRVQHSLALTLADCGYHTVYLSPLPYSFVNEGPFVESIGFEAFIDQHAMKAPSTHQSDAFYYEYALDYIRRHRVDDGRPVFMVILNMSAHSPWDFRMAPEVVLDGEPFDEDTSLNEYYRRLAISRVHLKDFRRQLEKKPNGRSVLMLEFGDHQPGFMLPHWTKIEGSQALGDPKSNAYLTFYQFLSAGAELKANVPVFEKLDVQYLAPTLLEVAGLPLDPVHKDLRDMRDLCGGVFASCGIEGRIEAHFRCREDQSQCLFHPDDQTRHIYRTSYSAVTN